jgi:hypothetical protein
LAGTSEKQHSLRLVRVAPVLSKSGGKPPHSKAALTRRWFLRLS